ncbi:MAG: hypothetical protein JKP98_12795 [Rhodobacteraceae bacterium]|mgnify:CR=1 FL=1|jgi:hypothetical protein|nr:hypothetical protein [Alphaproteobacteria bacterium]MBL4557588.1 hypothetical protein [Paracoccaceae bacterium]MBL4557659.1 hypothetical protein [Paracoccaceae bacterium]
MFKLYDKSNAMARVTIKGRRALHYDGLHLGDCDDRVSYEWHDSFYVAGRSKKAGPRILPTAHIPGLHYTGALYPDDPLSLAERLGFYKGAVVTVRPMNGTSGPGSRHVL